MNFARLITRHIRSFARFLDSLAESPATVQKIKDYNKFATSDESKPITAYTNGQRELDRIFRENPGRIYHVILEKRYVYTHNHKDAILVLPWSVYIGDEYEYSMRKFVATEITAGVEHLSLLFSKVNLDNCPDYIDSNSVFAYNPRKYYNVWTYWKSDFDGYADLARLIRNQEERQ